MINRGWNQQGVDKSRQFQLHQDHADKCRHRRTAGFDDKAGGLPIEGIANSVELAQLGTRVSDLKQRTMRIVSQTAGKFIRRGVEIHDDGLTFEQVAVGLTKDDPPPRCENPIALPGQCLREHLRLDIAKRRLPFTIKKRADRLADPLFDHAICVGERRTEAPRQLPPDGGLAPAWHSDQDKWFSETQFLSVQLAANPYGLLT